MRVLADWGGGKEGPPGVRLLIHPVTPAKCFTVFLQLILFPRQASKELNCMKMLKTKNKNKNNKNTLDCMGRMFSALEVEQRQVNRDPTPAHTDEADVLAVTEHCWASTVKSEHLWGQNSRATPSCISKRRVLWSQSLWWPSSEGGKAGFLRVPGQARRHIQEMLYFGSRSASV